MKDEIICYCKNVKKSVIANAIENGAKNIKDIQTMTKACTGNQCKNLNPKGKCCFEDIQKILEEFEIKNTDSGCSKCEGCC
ncbi:MAG: (2Fe-2S)-binding protein [Nanoarchaeota archaeon]|nr:(2Fe-2S)-binding protein [Nanoarchaeota archaeon]